MIVFLQSEDRAKAVQAWSKIYHSMTVLGISESEMTAIYSVLAAIYHLGAAGTVKGSLCLICFSFSSHLCFVYVSDIGIFTCYRYFFRHLFITSFMFGNFHILFL